MELPRAVKEAKERANALIMEMAKQREGTPEAPVPAPEPEPEARAEETETAGSPQEPVTEEGQGEGSEAQPAPPEGENVPPSPSKPPEEDYETKYKVLKGKYDKEVPELAGQVAFLVKKVAALEEALAEKEKALKEEPAKPEEPAVKEEPAKDLTEDPKVKYFQTEYPDIFEGTDIVAKARAKEEFAKIEPRVKEIARAMFKEELEKLNQRLSAIEGHTVQTTRQSFYDALYKAYPDWESIQASPEFAAFIQAPDELSGIPRWQLLKDAYDKLDAQRAIRFFDIFTSRSGGGNAQPQVAKSQGQPAQKPGLSKKVEAMIAPPRSQSSGIPQPKEPQKKVTPEEIKQFYQDVALGKWRGREDEKRKEEARLIRGILGQV